MRRETLLRGKSVHIQYVHDGIVLRSRRESNWRSHSSEFTMWIICSEKNWITDRNENRRESSMWVTLYKPYFMVFGCFTLYTHFTISLRICIVDNGKFAICDYHIFGMDFNQFLFCTPRLEPFVTCMGKNGILIYENLCGGDLCVAQLFCPNFHINKREMSNKVVFTTYVGVGALIKISIQNCCGVCCIMRTVNGRTRSVFSHCPKVNLNSIKKPTTDWWNVIWVCTRVSLHILYTKQDDVAIERLRAFFITRYWAWTRTWSLELSSLSSIHF